MNDCIINYGILVFRLIEVILLNCMMFEYFLKKLFFFENIKIMYNFLNIFLIKILINRFLFIFVMYYMYFFDIVDYFI